MTETVIEPPNFSVETFFYFLSVMMLVSFAAFSAMDLLPAIKKLHVEAKPEKKPSDLDEEMKMIEKSKCSFFGSIDRRTIFQLLERYKRPK